MEAEGFSKSQSIKGIASAEARKEKIGTAQPSNRGSNQTSTIVEPMFEPIPISFNPLTLNNNTTPTPSAALPGFDLVLQKPLSRKEKKKQKLGTFRKETVELIDYLLPKWPIERLGKKIPNDGIKACENVEWIIDSFSDVTLETLRVCADGWLALGQECPNAIQFFFGTGPRAPWRAEGKSLNLPE